MQTGKTFQSYGDYKKYCRDNNIEVVSNREFQTNLSEPSEEPWDHRKFVEAAKDGWEEVIEGGKRYEIPKVDRTTTAVVDSQPERK